MGNRLIGTVLAGLAVPAVVGCGPGDGTNAATTLPDGANAAVVDVVDGDTIDVDITGRIERVRLIGIDTPETKKPDAPVECYGPEASAFTASLLPEGTLLRIERDVVGRDDYGRLLGYVFRTDDGTFVNDEIVRQGFATLLTIEPNTAHQARFADSARAAHDGGIGLWGACRGR